MSSTMSSTLSAQALEGNRLLALLPLDTRRRMLPAFTLMSLGMSHLLYEPDRTRAPSEVGEERQREGIGAKGWSVSRYCSEIPPPSCGPSRKFLGWLCRWGGTISCAS